MNEPALCLLVQYQERRRLRVKEVQEEWLHTSHPQLPAQVPLLLPDSSLRVLGGCFSGGVKSIYNTLLLKASHVVSLEYTWACVTCLKTCLNNGQLLLVVLGPLSGPLA